MGRPMKNRILSVVLAISMIAVVFAAVPVGAEVNDTGLVIATDSANGPKNVFIRGELVYFDVKTVYLGNVSSRAVTVTLGSTGIHSHVTTNATTGWYNSSAQTPKVWLDTSNVVIAGDVQALDVIATVGGVEIGRYPITIKQVGLKLDPNLGTYWPGVTVAWKLVISHMTEQVYVHIVNDTGATVYNLTALASTGFLSSSFTVGPWKDGTYDMEVRYSSNNTIVGATLFPNPYILSFDIARYTFTVSPERTWFLPGETAVMDYSLEAFGTAGVPSGVTIKYWAVWWVHQGNKTVWNWLNGTLDAAQTQQNFAIPSNIALNHTPAVHILYWANATNASIMDTVDLHVDVISASVSLHSPTPMPGDPQIVTVNAFVDGGHALPGANVTVTVTRNGTEVIDAYGASGLTTDIDGVVGYTFNVAQDAAKGDYVVKATVSKLGFSTSRETEFSVTWGGSLIVALDKQYYYGGQEATATFKALWNRQPIPTGLVNYKFTLDSIILVVGNTTGTSASVTIPQDKVSGAMTLTVEADMVYLENPLHDSDTAGVNLAAFTLVVLKDSYRAGDTITWAWTIVSGLDSGPLSYQIFDDFGVRVAEGSPTFAKTGTFKFVVPKVNPAVDYTGVMTWAPPIGDVMHDDATANLVSELEFKVWIEKSPYADGAFAPGGTVKIKYSIVTPSVFEETGRPAYRIHIAVDNDPIELDVLVSKASGEISYKIPKTATVGELGVTAQLFDATNGLELSPMGGVGTSFVVNNRESAWDLSLGGMTLSDLLILILLVVVILVLIIMPWAKNRMGRPKPPEAVPPAPSEQGKVPPPSP